MDTKTYQAPGSALGALPPPLAHDEALDIAAEEYERILALLAGLTPADWQRPTDCVGWAVRDIVAHLAGAAHASGSLRELIRQMRAGRRYARELPVDRMNAVQVAERAGRSPAELVEELRTLAPQSVASRRRTPALLRRVPIPMPPPVNARRPAGWLADVVYTRDAWMHRIDICRATGREPALSDAHDGRLIAGVVTDWATAHGQPFDLLLTGPAGGHYGRGREGQRHALDAVEFARTVSGRAAGPGLLAQGVLF